MSQFKSRDVVRVVAGVAVTAMALALSVATASASFGINSLTAEVSSAQAGAHPDFTVKFNTNLDGSGLPEGNMRTVNVDLPTGLLGNPNAVPKCDMARVVAGTCAADSAVGWAKVEVQFLPGEPFFLPVQSLIYNIEPYPDEPAAFGMAGLIPIRFDTSLRSDGTYNIRTSLQNLTEAGPILTSNVTFWGVPADHNGPGSEFHDDRTTLDFGGPGSGDRRPFLTNPTRCSGQPLRTTLGVASWQHPSDLLTYSADTAAMEGCEKLDFSPTIKVTPSTLKAGAPAGYAIDIEVPQSEDAGGFATPHLEDATLTLPEGVVLSPSVAHGLGACSDGQLGLHSLEKSACPDSSRIGTVSVYSPLLPGPISGGAYIGAPLPGNRYRLFLSLDGYGAKVKLEGKVTLDPVSGQITATFLDNPELPFSKLHLELKDGPGAPLANPTSCGVKTATAELRSDAGQTASPSGSFTLISGCSPRGFSPKWAAGSTDPIAGASGPFEVRVSRTDIDQELGQIIAEMPEGLLGMVSQVPLCPSAAAAAGACSQASQIGSTITSAGPGSSPFPVAGRVFLTEGYGGAPFGLSFLTPAVAGPYDLGVVNVRAKILVDPQTAALRVESTPLPRILEGVPLQIAAVRILLDRPGFMRNPTSCAEKAVGGTILSSEGTRADVSSRFQAVECRNLAFGPKLALSLSGSTHRSAHPKLRATLTMPRGAANVRKATVTLPKTEFLENAHIKTICTRVQYAARACPAESIYGYAKAWTPVLDQPLAGPVYLRSSNHELPDLVASLDGQIHVDLVGRIDSVHARIRNTFESVPDAPVSKFVLTMQGGKKGLLVNNTELCKAVPRAAVAFDGQNGKVADSSPVVRTDCGKRRKVKK